MSQYLDDMKLYGAVLYNLLGDPTAYSYEIIGDRIYPVIIEQDVDIPAIAYTYEVQPVNTKRPYNRNEDVIFNLYCFSANYEECVKLTKAVRDTMDRTGVTDAGGPLTFSHISFVGQDHAQYDKERNLYMIPVIYKFQLQRESNL